MLTNREIERLIRMGKRDCIPPEDLQIYEENLQARKRYTSDSMRRLGAGICLQAIADWKRPISCIHTKDSNGRKLSESEILERCEAVRRQCEAFFDSPVFTEYTGVDGKREAVRLLMKMPPNVTNQYYQYKIKRR